MTKTKDKQPKKKRPAKKKKVRTTLKKSIFYAMTFSCSLLFLFYGILIFYPYTRTLLITKISEKYLTKPTNITFHFDQAYLNFWDFSINFKDFYIKNLAPFPDEPAFQSGHIKTKMQVLPNFQITYDIYISNLQLNLYYIPGKGTNIGSIFRTLKKEQDSNKETTHNIRSFSIEKVEIVITQHLEPQKIEIHTPKHFYSDKQSNNASSCYIYILECMINSLIINNPDIPEDFRTSLINDMKQNTI